MPQKSCNKSLAQSEGAECCSMVSSRKFGRRHLEARPGSQRVQSLEAIESRPRLAFGPWSNPKDSPGSPRWPLHFFRPCVRKVGLEVRCPEIQGVPPVWIARPPEGIVAAAAGPARALAQADGWVEARDRVGSERGTRGSSVVASTCSTCRVYVRASSDYG